MKAFVPLGRLNQSQGIIMVSKLRNAGFFIGAMRVIDVKNEGGKGGGPVLVNISIFMFAYQRTVCRISFKVPRWISVQP
ncbi:hypothetical protein, partial [Pedobacter sp.]|uniref:hypothetical protein n=1 Tax=Pedobacter sp. TaxID=1411316 RepID=UPI003C675945